MKNVCELYGSKMYVNATGHQEYRTFHKFVSLFQTVFDINFLVYSDLRLRFEKCNIFLQVSILIISSQYINIVDGKAISKS